MSSCKIRRPALFLDRDGVINYDYGYVHKSDHFILINGTLDLVRNAYERGYRVVVTNQADIGRGYYTEDQFHQLTYWMCDQFLANGVPIDKIFLSPCNPTWAIGKYLKDDFSRKPHPEMILKACTELNIDLRKSVLIGDKSSDSKAGFAADIRMNLFFSEKRRPELEGFDYTNIVTLHEAIDYLKPSWRDEGV